MYKAKEYQHPNEIPARAYEGYIWSCQSEVPALIDSRKEYSFDQWSDFPFILEGLLHHQSEQEAYSIVIRYTDQYHIQEYDLKNLPKGAELKSYQYIAHRFNGIEKIQFDQLWLPEADLLCCDMPVMRLQTRLFTGFT